STGRLERGRVQRDGKNPDCIPREQERPEGSAADLGGRDDPGGARVRQSVSLHVGEGGRERRDRVSVPRGTRRQGAIREKSRRRRIRIIMADTRGRTLHKTEYVLEPHDGD